MRNLSRIPDLAFPNMMYGRQETPWDLKMLLYIGGAAANRRKVMKMIDAGELGDPVLERLELVVRLHEIINNAIVGGGSRDSLESNVELLRRMFSYADKSGQSLTLSTVEATYQFWTDALHHRVNVLREMKATTAYAHCATVGRLIDQALDRQSQIIELTGAKFPQTRKTARGVKAEKQNLEDTFKFGHFLQDVCDGLTVETILKSHLPVRIPLRSGKEIVTWSGYGAQKTRENLDNRQLDTPQRRFSAKKSDQMFISFENEGTLKTRSPLANMRITAELFMFIGQTGMNLAQAFKLKIHDFFYSSHIDGYQVREYKSRRGGEVLFEIFRDYKPHFERYLAWRRELFPESLALFPLLRTNGRAENMRPTFPDFRLTCLRIGIPFISSSGMRNTRVNWMLRRSGDPDLTAEMLQHTKETLLSVYERPSLQRALGEVTRFWEVSDPALSCMVPVAPGLCNGKSAPVSFIPKGVTQPDCIHASGCLWCEHHRDIDSEDYCWSLASFRHVKVIEISKWHAPEGTKDMHPGEHTLDRISEKLHWFHESNNKRRGWIDEVLARVEEGNYHPDWKRLIDDAEGNA